MKTVTLGTRGSALACIQTEWVIACLAQAWPGLVCSVMVISTQGDRSLERALPEFGGKGVFTQEIEAALRARRIDLAVHSLKDLPIEPSEELTLGAICVRADARDVLVSRHGVGLAQLPAGPRVGTSSVRRAAQVAAARPDAKITGLRGNVDTRLRKAATQEYDAVILAAAGLIRLGLADRITEWLSLETMLPAPGQGAVAVQCRADDAAARELLAPLHHTPTATAVMAERAFLSGLGGGCHAPIAAWGVVENEWVRLRGLVADPGGQCLIRVEGQGSDAEVLGGRLARQALDEGAAAWLR